MQQRRIGVAERNPPYSVSMPLLPHLSSPCSSTSTLTPVPDSPLTPAPPSPEPVCTLETTPVQYPPGHADTMPHLQRRRTAKRTRTHPDKGPAKRRKSKKDPKSTVIEDMQPVRNQATSKAIVGVTGVAAYTVPSHQLERAERESTAGTIEVADMTEDVDFGEVDQPSRSRQRAQACPATTRPPRRSYGLRMVPMPKNMVKSLYTIGDRVPVPIVKQTHGDERPLAAQSRSASPKDRLIRSPTRIQPIRGPEEAASNRSARSISSRKFAKVLRLLAGLPPLSSASQQRPKCLGPLPLPPVWAEVRRLLRDTLCSPQSRQELCEALPYYRAFQSGLYMNSRIAYGYLLEAFGAP